MDYKVKLHEYKNEISLRNKIFRLIWSIVYSLFFRPFISQYLNFWRVFILRVFGAKIGRNCSISASVKIWAPWNLEMADYTLLANKVHCYNAAKIKICSESVVSEGSFLCTATHDITSPRHTLICKSIIIEDQVWVAVDTFIGPGVTIRQGAVVGARACVFKDVEPWTVVGGNPAKFIKKRIIVC